MKFAHAMPAAVAVALTLMILGTTTAASAQQSRSVPGCPSIADKRIEIGCYTLAHVPLGPLPATPVYWHLDTFATRAAAEAAKGARGTVVDAFQQQWLFTIADRDWRPRGGQRLASIGPLPLPQAADFSAMYLEATFVPGGSVAAHRHSGPEAWYTLSGTQCLETSEGTSIAHAGESTIIPGGLPMALLALGSEVRRSLVLVLHDASQPASTFTDDWSPKGLCDAVR